MGYKLQAKLRIDLGDLGDNNGTPFFVEIKNPKLISFEKKIEINKMVKGKNEVEQMQAMKEVARRFILAWNLLDIETENPVDVSKADAVDHVPSTVIERIFKEMSPEQDEETKNSSEQSANS